VIISFKCQSSTEFQVLHKRSRTAHIFTNLFIFYKTETVHTCAELSMHETLKRL